MPLIPKLIASPSTDNAIRSRKVPGPLSARLVTVRVAPALTKGAANKPHAHTKNNTGLYRQKYFRFFMIIFSLPRTRKWILGPIQSFTPIEARTPAQVTRELERGR